MWRERTLAACAPRASTARSALSRTSAGSASTSRARSPSAARQGGRRQGRARGGGRRWLARGVLAGRGHRRRTDIASYRVSEFGRYDWTHSTFGQSLLRSFYFRQGQSCWAHSCVVYSSISVMTRRPADCATSSGLVMTPILFQVRSSRVSVVLLCRLAASKFAAGLRM